MSDDLIGVPARMEQLAGDDELLGYLRTSETDDGVYFVVARCWEHPDLDDGHTLSLRYAYLTRGEGGDGWIGGDGDQAAGINVRVEPDVDPADMAGELAGLLAGSSARLDHDGETNAYSADVRDE